MTPRSRASGIPLALVLTGCAMDDGPSDWMGSVFRGRGEVAIGDVLLPGTHDSASYGCQPENGISPHAGELLVSLWELPGAEGPGGSRERVAGWARTQGRTIAEQLSDGVRALDLRVTLRDGDLLTWHSVYSVPLSDVLDDLVAFADAHPREVIVLSFGLDLTEAEWPPFADALTRPRVDGVSVCDLLLDAPGPVARVTLDEAWSRGRNLVWGADGELRAWLDTHVDCPMSDQRWQSHWSRTTSPEGVDAVLAATVPGRDPDALLSNDFIFSLEGTDDRLAQLGYVTGWPTLREATAALGFSGDLPGHLIAVHNADGQMNVFSGDFVTETDLVASAIAANEAELAR